MLDIVSVLLAVGLLTLLIAWGKVQPLLAFVAASLLAALLLGVPLKLLFGGANKRTLFILTHHALYAAQIN